LTFPENPAYFKHTKLELKHKRKVKQFLAYCQEN